VSINGAVALLVQVNNLDVIERNGPALVNAPGLGGLDARALALADKSDLHLGDHAQHGQDHLAYWALGRDLRLEHPEMRSLAFKLMDQVQNIGCAAAKSVELDYN
jgi:hypothetical protein